MHFLYRNFDLRPFAATCYGTRQLNVDSFGVQAMDHVVVWCFLAFAVSPGTWPGGCLVSWRAPPWFFAVAARLSMIQT